MVCPEILGRSRKNPGIRGLLLTQLGGQSKLYSSDGKRRIWEAIYYGVMVARNTELRRFDIILAGQWPLFHLIPARFFCLIGQSKLVVDWWEVWGRDQWLKYFGLKGLLGLLLEKIMSRITSKYYFNYSKRQRSTSWFGCQKGWGHIYS